MLQEVKLGSSELLKATLSPAVRTSPRIAGRRDMAAGELNGKQQQHQHHFGTASKAAASGLSYTGQPRQCVLHKGKKGFGFVLRGAKVSHAVKICALGLKNYK